MSQAKTIAITSIVTFIVTSALWVGGITLLYLYFTDFPSFAVTIDAPAEVAIEEEFELTVNVVNPSAESVTLGSIDIYNSLLKGFEVMDIDPRPSESSEIFDFYTASFSHELQAGERFSVSYSLKAKESGLWIGDIDCSMASRQAYTLDANSFACRTAACAA